MSKINVYYLLSETGQKDAILSDQIGSMVQELCVDPTQELLDLSVVDKMGNARCYIGYAPEKNSFNPSHNFNQPTIDFYFNKILCRVDSETAPTFFDSIQSVESLLKWNKEKGEYLKTKRAELEILAVAAQEELEKKCKIQREKQELAEKVKMELQAKDISRILMGEGTATSNNSISLEGRNYYSDHYVGIRQEIDRREETARSMLLSEASNWIEQHGSERLQMIVQAKLLPHSIKIYHEERTAHEFGMGWNFFEEEEADCLEDPHNPPMNAVNKLIEMRGAHPDSNVNLFYINERKEYCLTAINHAGASIWYSLK